MTREGDTEQPDQKRPEPTREDLNGVLLLLLFVLAAVFLREYVVRQGEKAACDEGRTPAAQHHHMVAPGS